MMSFHYLLPVVTMGLWGIVIFLTRGRNDIAYYGIAFACYLALLILHFNVKLWIPLINSANWDPLYWSIDQRLRPLIDFCFAIRAHLEATVGDIDRWYLLGFVLMFYLSFILHAVQSSAIFRRLVVASFLVHALGALLYLVMPAVGPFIYEQGGNAAATRSQIAMLEAHHTLRATGTVWLSANASQNLMAGLAAMPSLHTAASAVFLYFGWRYLPVLLPLYLPGFLFILIEAVATRWHYVIDLPVGAALAAFSIWAAHRVYPLAAPEEGRQRNAAIRPAPVAAA